jgi:hypothetical protein
MTQQDSSSYVWMMINSIGDGHLDWSNEYQQRMSVLPMGISAANMGISMASETANYGHILEWIRTRPASIDERGGSIGCTSLGYAIMRGDLGLVKFLLSQGASVVIANNNGGNTACLHPQLSLR